MKRATSQIVLDDGKYTVVEDNGKLSALRYGQSWRDLTGDKLVLCMMQEIEKLQREKQEVQEESDKHLAEYERLATSTEKQCSTIYYDLIDLLKVPPGGSLYETVNAMKEALEFYGNKENYSFSEVGEDEEYLPIAPENDPGARARQALDFWNRR